MRQIYQCERCGKVFQDYDSCYQHEEKHWNVCDWGRQYERASASFIHYSEKEEAPTVVGVELRRWDDEKNEEVHGVAIYHLKEVFMSDRLTSDAEYMEQDKIEDGVNGL